MNIATDTVLIKSNAWGAASNSSFIVPKTNAITLMEIREMRNRSNQRLARSTRIGDFRDFAHPLLYGHRLGAFALCGGVHFGALTRTWSLGETPGKKRGQGSGVDFGADQGVGVGREPIGQGLPPIRFTLGLDCHPRRYCGE